MQAQQGCEAEEKYTVIMACNIYLIIIPNLDVAISYLNNLCHKFLYESCPT